MIDSHGGLFRSVTDTVTHCFRGRQFSIRFDGRVHENTFITNPCPSTRLKAATVAAQAASLRCFLVGSLPTPWNIQVGSCLNTGKSGFSVSDSPGGPLHKNEKFSFTTVNQGLGMPHPNRISSIFARSQLEYLDPWHRSHLKVLTWKTTEKVGVLLRQEMMGETGFWARFMYIIYIYTKT